MKFNLEGGNKFDLFDPVGKTEFTIYALFEFWFFIQTYYVVRQLRGMFIFWLKLKLSSQFQK